MWPSKRKAKLRKKFVWLLYSFSGPTMLLIFIFTASLFHTMKVTADGTFSLQLINYTNPLHLTSAGVCCEEPAQSSNCKSDCDNYFIICISAEKNGDCSLGYYWLDEIGRDQLIFSSSFWGISPLNIPNPMRMPVPKWKSGIYIKIEVYDNDFGVSKSNHIKNTHVETFSIDYTQRPRWSDASPKPFEILVARGSYAKIYLGLRIQCKEKYLVPGCDVYCVDTDDARGHYTCDYKLGKKLCHSGWYGQDCATKVPLCTPRDDASGHYTCNNATDEKVCLPGWKNPLANCTEAISLLSRIVGSTLTVTKRSLSLATSSSTSTAAYITEEQISSLSKVLSKYESKMQTSHNGLPETSKGSTPIEVSVTSSPSSQTTSFIQASQSRSESSSFKEVMAKSRASTMEAVSSFLTSGSREEKRVIPTSDQKGKRTLIYSSLIGPFIVLIVSVAILLTRMAYVRHRNRVSPMEANTLDTKANKLESPGGRTRCSSTEKTWARDLSQNGNALPPNSSTVGHLMSTTSRKTQITLQETGL